MRKILESEAAVDLKQRLKDRVWGFGQLEMYKEAINELRKLARLYPDDCGVLFDLGRYSCEKGDGNRAIRYYKYAIKKFPNEPNLYANLGYTYKRLKKRPDLARICYEKALSLQPDNVWALNNTGSIIDKEGLFVAALAYYRKAWHSAKREGRVDYIIWDNLAWAYYRRKHFRRALVILRHLVEQYPNKDVLYQALGMVNYKLGAYDTAWDMFSIALSMKPDSRHYKRLYELAKKKIIVLNSTKQKNEINGKAEKRIHDGKR